MGHCEFHNSEISNTKNFNSIRRPILIRRHAHPLLIALFVCGSWAITAAAQKPQSSAATPSNGKVIYTQHCQTCHQVDGAGAPNMIPTLIKTDYVLGNKARLIGILLKGLKGDITVNGDPFAGEMPAQDTLKDAEIA